MSARRYRSTISSLALVVTFIVAACGLAFAQDGIGETTIPPSSAPAQVARPATTTDEPADESAPKPVKPANVIPYTVRSGDTIGAIAAMFGISPKNSLAPTGCTLTTSCRWTRC